MNWLDGWLCLLDKFDVNYHIFNFAVLRGLCYITIDFFSKKNHHLFHTINILLLDFFLKSKKLKWSQYFSHCSIVRKKLRVCFCYCSETSTYTKRSKKKESRASWFDDISTIYCAPPSPSPFAPRPPNSLWKSPFRDEWRKLKTTVLVTSKKILHTNKHC